MMRAAATVTGRIGLEITRDAKDQSNRHEAHWTLAKRVYLRISYRRPVLDEWIRLVYASPPAEEEGELLLISLEVISSKVSHSGSSFGKP